MAALMETRDFEKLELCASDKEDKLVVFSEERVGLLVVGKMIIILIKIGSNLAHGKWCPNTI